MPVPFAEYNRRRRQRWYEILDYLKALVGCQECGWNGNPVALQFDHKDPSKKVAGISRMAADLNPDNPGHLERVFDELDKCRILCANCHCIKTHAENDHGTRR